ncbi:MAG: hypothetical protein ACRD4I_06415, partial [Candidatus Angelobacter sp.]
MRKNSVLSLAVVFTFALAGSAFAQQLTDAAQAQVGTSTASGALPGIAPQTIHSVPSDLIDEDSTNSGPSSIAGNPGGVAGVISVPNFTRSFSFGGQDFPFTMIGNDPSLGHKTQVPAKIAAVSLQLLNEDGSTFAIVPAGEFEQPVLNSPNFQNFKYEKEGEPVQFGDAVQRAEFFNSMKGNWHTELSPASVVDRLTIQVPKFVTVISRGVAVKALN